MYQLIFLLPIVFTIGYIIIKHGNYDSRVVAVYKHISIPVILLLFLFYYDSSGTLMTSFLSITLSLVWIFRDLLSNLGSTLYLWVIPQGWHEGDKFSLNLSNLSNQLVFKEIGFLRTEFTRAGSSELVYIPNRTLLSGKLAYLPKAAS
jgi:hypothetical protein